MSAVLAMVACKAAVMIDPREAVVQMFRNELAANPTKAELVGLVEGAASNLSKLFNDNARVGAFSHDEIVTYSFCSCVIGSFIKAFGAEESLAFGDSERLVEQLRRALNDPRGRTTQQAIYPRQHA